MYLPKNRKNNKAREEAGETVDGRGDESVAVAVVVELVVARQRQQGAEPWTQREEDLGRCVDPHLNIKELLNKSIF